MLQAFNALWEAALAEGKSLHEAEAADLTEAISALAAENQTLEGNLVAARNRIAELEGLQTAMAAEVTNRSNEASQARETAERHSARLSQALEKIESLQSSHVSLPIIVETLLVT